MPSLSEMLRRALSRFTSASTVDRRVVEELVRDLQRALLVADVSVELVQKLSENIRERALREGAPPGISRKDHVIKVVYEELVKLLGERPATLEIRKTPYVIMMVGIQGSGKTTSVAKLANYLKKMDKRVGVICADTYRPGAYEQLKQLLNGREIPVYYLDGVDAVEIAKHGIEEFSDEVDVIIIDTAGRHRSQESLMREMEVLQERIKPDEVMLVIDATIGQMAGAHAKAFHKVAPIGSIILTKMDSSAKGGGALSAVAETGARIKFLGVGEKIEDIELFDPSRYVGRLLGMGDIQGILERIRLAEMEVSEERARAFLRGDFTLTDFVNQLKEMKKTGPLSKLFSKLPIPGLPQMSDEMLMETERQIDKWVAAVNSMTPEERSNPKLLHASRIKRVARGAGISERDVKRLLRQYRLTKKLMRTAKRSPKKILRKLYGGMR